MRSKSLSLLIGLFLIASVTLLAQNKLQTDTTELGRISSVKGDVFFQDSEKAEINLAVLKRDILSTRKGRIEVDLGQGNYVWLDKKTIVAFTAPQQESILLTIWQGTICLRVGTKVIEVQTLRQKPLRPEIGFYQIDVKDDELEIDRNPRPADPFSVWASRRKGYLDRLDRQRYLSEQAEQADADYGYGNYYGGWSYGPYYPYVGLPWSFYLPWFWLNPYHYLGLYPWGWGYGYYGDYYGGYYGGYGYGYDPYYSRDSRGQTVVSKKRLKKRTSQNLGVNQAQKSTKAVATTTRLTRLSKTGQIESTRSRNTKNTIKKYSSRIRSSIRSSSRSVVERNQYSKSSSRYIRSRSSYSPGSRSARISSQSTSSSRSSGKIRR